MPQWASFFKLTYCSLVLPPPICNCQAYAERIFDRVYRDDISRLATMEDLWKKRAPPKPQPPLRQLLPDLDVELGAALKAAQGAGAASAAVGVSACKALGLKNPNAKWDAADNARIFVTAVVAFLTLVRARCARQR